MWANNQKIKGIGEKGITEQFPLEGYRSLYGATKLASELMIQEYHHLFGMPAIINRCGVLSGPWQMGKVDQGVTVLLAGSPFLSTKFIIYRLRRNGKTISRYLTCSRFSLVARCTNTPVGERKWAIV